MGPNFWQQKSMQPVYLIVGVSGSGKTWVCKQLTDKFNYVPHDEHFVGFEKVLLLEAQRATMPIITECPFGERLVKESLEAHKVKVKPYFVVEPPDVCAERYLKREGKEITKAAYTRAYTIVKRALEWKAPMGNSEEILEKLKKI